VDPAAPPGDHSGGDGAGGGQRERAGVDQAGGFARR
jgi:hypothetical protein